MWNCHPVKYLKEKFWQLNRAPVAAAGATGRKALGRRPLCCWFDNEEAALEVSELSKSTSDSKENTGLIIPCSCADWE